MIYKEQLTVILKASDWSQEQLAHTLGVSFATVNAWLRERATPRKDALLRIERLYLDIVGSETVDPGKLAAIKEVALTLKITPSQIIKRQEVLDKLTLYLTYHTNTIEGSTMTLADVEEVIFEHKVLSNRTAVEQAEARNHQAALNWVLESLETDDSSLIDETFIKSIHLRLMNGIVGDAGQYRRHSVRIMGSRAAVANWLKVPELMHELVGKIDKNSKDIIYHLAKTHADFEQIHPFSDGNGRTGRLILLAMALKAGLVPPIVVKERKHAYYKYLEMAQTKDDYTPMELFIAESIDFASTLLSKK